MARLGITALLAVVAVGCRDGSDPDDVLHSDSQAEQPIQPGSCLDPMAEGAGMIDLHLRMSRATWTQIARDSLEFNGTCDQFPYHEVEFRCGDDEPWIVIGARRKRGDHFGLDNPEKPFLKLDFNEFVKGQEWPESKEPLGYRKLTLSNGQLGRPGSSAPILGSEEVAWRLLREEIPEASESTFAKLFVHFPGEDTPEYHGVYLAIEDLNRKALERRFGTAEGLLEKNTGSNCDGPVFDDGPPNQATDKFNAWEMKDPSDHEGGWLAETQTGMQLDGLLRQEAMRDILHNYANIMGEFEENFLFYDAVGGTRLWLPWDLDQAFGAPGTATDRSVLECLSRLASRTRCHHEIEPSYLELVCELLNTALSVDNILATVNAVDRELRPELPMEDHLWGDRQLPLSTNSDGMDSYQEQLDHMLAWIPSRIEDVRRQLDAAGYPCPLP